MKKKTDKQSQEQINATRQKKLSSFGYKNVVKNLIEAMKTYNINCRKSELKSSDIRKLSKYFAEYIDVSSSRVRDTASADGTADNSAPTKSLKY